MQVLSLSNPWTLLNRWMNSNDCEVWKNKINSNLIWEKPLICVYGTVHSMPREIAFLAEEEISYRYSGIKHIGKGWPNWFHPLLEMVSTSCDVDFNGCLVNLYRDGKDRMGWHADNEPELDLTKPIASLSLGQTRDFFFKHRSKNLKKAISLKNGDLLIMHPNCQDDWLHSVPSRMRIVQPRINLTFRCYKKLLK